MKPITINNFQLETAHSAYLGFEEMRGVDTKNKPGAILASDALVKESVAIVDDEIFMTCVDDNGVIYGISKENTNSVFKRVEAGTWTELADFTASGIYGIAFWEGHIILIHSDGGLDASADDGATWTNDFDTITANDGSMFPTILAQDGKLYICCANNVATLALGTDGVFDPTGASPAKWQLTQSALDLPSQYEIRSVVALGDKLMFGTTNTEDSSDATIFPWDRVSDSFFQPIRVKENGITYMVEVENLLYIMAGTKGRWYVSNGASISFLAEIPKTMFDLTSINLARSFNNAVAYNEGLIYFGVSYTTAGGAGNKLGVYSLNPKTRKINFAHIISTDNIGVTVGLNIGSITKAIRTVGGVSKESIVVTWTNATGTPSYGADALTNTKYTSDRAFFVTQFLQVGTSQQEASFSSPEVRLSKPLASGDSFKIYTRTAQNGTWVLHYTEATVGFQSGIFPAISAKRNLQLKVTLNQNTELLEIILK